MKWRCSTGRPAKANTSSFLTFRNGYHGDTFGAMSVCDPQNSMHSLWQGYLPDNLFAPPQKADARTRWIRRLPA